MNPNPARLCALTSSISHWTTDSTEECLTTSRRTPPSPPPMISTCQGKSQPGAGPWAPAPPNRLQQDSVAGLPAPQTALSRQNHLEQFLRSSVPQASLLHFLLLEKLSCPRNLARCVPRSWKLPPARLLLKLQASAGCQPPILVKWVALPVSPLVLASTFSDSCLGST